jgi:hypothetical protein
LVVIPVVVDTRDKVETYPDDPIPWTDETRFDRRTGRSPLIEDTKIVAALKEFVEPENEPKTCPLILLMFNERELRA